MIKKFSKSDKNRKEDIQAKMDKVSRTNQSMKVKSQSFFEEKSKENDIYVQQTLSRIEDKMNRSKRLHDNYLIRKKEICNQHFYDVFIEKNIRLIYYL